MPSRERAARLKSQGMCVICGSPNRPVSIGSFYCEVCIKKSSMRYNQRKQLSLCWDCAKSIDRGAYCYECKKRKRDNQRARRASCKIKGICTRCMKPDRMVFNGISLCGICREITIKNSSKTRDRNAAEFGSRISPPKWKLDRKRAIMKFVDENLGVIQEAS